MKVEAYTAGGILSGAAAHPERLRDDLEAEAPVELARATWYPLGGGAAERRPSARLELDDVLLVVAVTGDLPIHATWHSVDLVAGPYRFNAELPTMPGFDPGRALARPGGPFVLLRDVRIELLDNPDAGRIERPQAFVNRYVVEQVAADIDLGFYFPGARYLTAAGAPLG